MRRLYAHLHWQRRAKVKSRKCIRWNTLQSFACRSCKHSSKIVVSDGISQRNVRRLRLCCIFYCCSRHTLAGELARAAFDAQHLPAAAPPPPPPPKPAASSPAGSSPEFPGSDSDFSSDSIMRMMKVGSAPLCGGLVACASQLCCSYVLCVAIHRMLCYFVACTSCLCLLHLPSPTGDEGEIRAREQTLEEKGHSCA